MKVDRLRLAVRAGFFFARKDFMPITPEERARIARENGARSKGPVTSEGKLRSARNSLKHGERADRLALFVPPHYACACNEDRQAFYALMDTLLAEYQPVNASARSVVREIAIATWEIRRLHGDAVNLRNLALIEQAGQPLSLDAEMADEEISGRAVMTLFGPSAALPRLSRQIDQLHLRIARLERRLKFVHSNFPSVSASTPEFVPENDAQPLENTAQEAPNEPGVSSPAETEHPIIINETGPEIVAAYRGRFPGRPIVVVSPDPVSRGEDIPDHLPPVPRCPPAA